MVIIFTNIQQVLGSNVRRELVILTNGCCDIPQSLPHNKYAELGQPLPSRSLIAPRRPTSVTVGAIQSSYWQLREEPTGQDEHNA